jgi:hypothetical protein
MAIKDAKTFWKKVEHLKELEKKKVEPTTMALHEVGKLPNGNFLWWEDNGVGGRRYWTDEVGGCGAMIWDTAYCDSSSLLAAIVAEESIRIENFYNSKAKS